MPPLARWALAWLIGLALGLARPPGDGPGIAMALLALGVIVALGCGAGRRADRPPWARAAAPIALALAAGLGRGAVAVADPSGDHVAVWNARGPVAVRGVVARPPDRRDRRTDYLVAVEAVRPTGAAAWAPARGLVLAQAARFPPRALGDRVVLTATLETPPDGGGGGFDYRAYLARRDVHALARRPELVTLEGGHGHHFRRALDALRERARRALDAALPEPAAALAIGILLGDARGIPAALDEAFRTTGTSHIIAISGANIALLVALLSRTLGRVIGRRRAAPATLVVVALYSLLVGGDPAVVRAALMGGVLVLGDALGRPTHAPTALLAAAAAMTAWRPAVLHDLGFQLSFAATAGLVAFARPLARRAERAVADRAPARAVLRALEEPVLVTLAAQVTTFPLVAYHVGEVSLIGLVANALVVPAQPAVMALGGATAVAGAAWAPLGRLLGPLAWLPLAWSIAVVERSARVPHAAVPWRMPLAMVVAYYALLLALAAGPPGRAAARRLRDRAVGLSRRVGAGTRPRVADEAGPPSRADGSALRVVAAALRRAPGRGGGWPALAASAALAALAWTGALARPDGLLHLHVLDVGQGDALLVVTPTGRRMLVDGGPSPSAVLAELGRRLAPWDRRLDVVVLTHLDADHVGGLAAVLARYDVTWLIDAGATHDTPEAAEYAAAAAAEGARRPPAASGLRITLDEDAGVTATVLWPPADAPDGPPNDRSIVLRLTHGRTAYLLTGDIEAAVESQLLGARAPLAADVLKVAHHGSNTSSTPAFLAAVHPTLALISAGRDNPFGHPTADTLARLAPARILRTDQEGALELLGDGRSLWTR